MSLKKVKEFFYRYLYLMPIKIRKPKECVINMTGLALRSRSLKKTIIVNMLFGDIHGLFYRT